MGRLHCVRRVQPASASGGLSALFVCLGCVGACVCVRAGQRRVCPGRRVRCPVLQMSVAATSPADPPRHPNSECLRPHSISI